MCDAQLHQAVCYCVSNYKYQELYIVHCQLYIEIHPMDLPVVRLLRGSAGRCGRDAQRCSLR